MVLAGEASPTFRPLRVLITNNTLSARGGSELFVRDLALALLGRGHTPIAYSTDLGEVARELEAATVPVINDLNALGAAPDVIHGHHHLDTMTALLHFDRTPVVSYCHGWLPWEEAPPPISPRILRYIAVDDTCRDRLVFRHGIPEDRVRVQLNFVDLDRFRPRSPLPDKPSTALIFSNYFSDGVAPGAIREACARLGIAVEVIGLNSGRASAAPESRLGAYDLVFAKGRSALEAMVTGNAVIVCDRAGLGGMVTVADVAKGRRLNFGIRQMREPIDVASVTGQILRYDGRGAAEVSKRLRAEAGMDQAVDELVSIYREVIAEAASQKTFDHGAESRSTSSYLRWLTPVLKARHDAEARVMRAETATEELAVQAKSAANEAERARILLAAQAQETETLSRRVAALSEIEARHSQAIAKQRQIEHLLQGVTEERDAQKAQLDRVVSSRAWRWIMRYGRWRGRLRSVWGLFSRDG